MPAANAQTTLPRAVALSDPSGSTASLVLSYDGTLNGSDELRIPLVISVFKAAGATVAVAIPFAVTVVGVHALKIANGGAGDTVTVTGSLSGLVATIDANTTDGAQITNTAISTAAVVQSAGTTLTLAGVNSTNNGAWITLTVVRN